MAENPNQSWEIYLRFLCESREAAKDSAIYWEIIEKYPFQLMQKLMTTIVDESLSQKKRESAALFVLEEMIHVGDGDEAESVIEVLYADINMQTLDFLRRSAMNLMISKKRNSVLQMCGEHMAMALVHSWLKTEQEWDEFLEFVEEGFTEPSSAHYLDIFLSIFRGLHPDLRDRLVSRMQPRITRNRAQFEAAVVQLLRDARDESPFLILPCIIDVFDQPLSFTFTRGAIMSNLFNDRTSYRNRYMLQIAVILRYCVQNTISFENSDDAFERLRNIIWELSNLTNSKAAVQLFRAFVVRDKDYNLPWKCGYRYRQ